MFATIWSFRVRKRGKKVSILYNSNLIRCQQGIAIKLKTAVTLDNKGLKTFNNRIKKNHKTRAPGNYKQLKTKEQMNLKISNLLSKLFFRLSKE